MINRIRIEGYKSIRNLDLELKPINILIGSNGVGKSNFLSFFKLVNNLYERRLSSYVISQDGAENLLHFGKKITENIYGKIEFSNINSRDSNSFYFNLLPTNNDNLFISTEGYGYNASWEDEIHNYFWTDNIKESELILKSDRKSVV